MMSSDFLYLALKSSVALWLTELDNTAVFPGLGEGRQEGGK